MKTLLASLGLLIALAACASPNRAISPDEAADLDYGPYPENHEEIVEVWLNDTLKDPFSAEYRIKSGPTQGYIRERSMWEGGLAGQMEKDIREVGYVVIVDVNAKNSFGAYTGWKEHRLLIRDGKVLGTFERNQHFVEPWYQ